MKKLKVFAAIMISITYGILRYKYYGEYGAYFNFLSAMFFIISSYLIYRVLSKRDRSLPLSKSLEEIARKRFGKHFGNYLVYEIKMVYGVFKFLCRPIKNYRLVMQSYFATPMLTGAFLGLSLAVISESVLVHFLINYNFQGSTRIVLNVVLILSEVFLLEMVLGNLYYLRQSGFRLIDGRVEIQMGQLWILNFPLSEVEMIDWDNLREMNDKTSRVALFQSPNLRVHLKNPIVAQRMFRQLEVKSFDLYLKDEDIDRFRSADILKATTHPAAALSQHST